MEIRYLKRKFRIEANFFMYFGHLVMFDLLFTRNECQIEMSDVQENIVQVLAGGKRYFRPPTFYIGGRRPPRPPPRL